MPTLRTVRVIANANNKRLRTVNLSATDNRAYEKVIASDTPARNCETVQDSGGAVAHLSTLYVSNYDVVEVNLALLGGGSLRLFGGGVLKLFGG